MSTLILLSPEVSDYTAQWILCFLRLCLRKNTYIQELVTIGCLRDIPAWNAETSCRNSAYIEDLTFPFSSRIRIAQVDLFLDF